MMSSPAPTQESGGPRSVRLAATGVALIVCLVYLPVLGNGFVNWDDGAYVNRDPLTKALPAAFTTFHASGNWHPLATLSHAVDHAVFGLWAPGHHLTSLVVHALNAGLVVLLCCAIFGVRALSRREILAAGIAAGLLWGLHPLRVECVAWVSERKELLCTLFYLLGLLGYLRHARGTSISRWYLATLACFAMALLSKPMAVSFPFLLLVLDAYPLARLRRPRLGRLLAEKLPFVLLAMASALLTLHAQRAAGAMRALADLPLRTRLSVAIQAPVAYLGKTLWPSELRALYSYPMLSDLASWWEAHQALASRLLALALLVILCWALKRWRRPLVVGLLSYLVMLLPVLGIVQVGPQAMAERYTYLPGIALAVLAGAAVGFVWDRAAAASRFWVATLAVLFGLVSTSLSGLTIKQIGAWHDSESLWTQVLAYEPDNIEAHNSRADYYYQRGNLGQALADYTAALAGQPAVSPVHASKRRAAIFNDRAVTLVQLGRLDAAVADESEAIRLRPNQADYYTNRARMFLRLGRTDAANADWQRAQALRADQ